MPAALPRGGRESNGPFIAERFPSGLVAMTSRSRRNATLSNGGDGSTCNRTETRQRTARLRVIAAATPARASTTAATAILRVAIRLMMFILLSFAFIDVLLDAAPCSGRQVRRCQKPVLAGGGLWPSVGAGTDRDARWAAHEPTTLPVRSSRVVQGRLCVVEIVKDDFAKSERKISNEMDRRNEFADRQICDGGERMGD